MSPAGEAEESALLARVSDTIRREGLLRPHDRIVVGLSGGADSVALLHVLLELGAEPGWDLLAVHVHHGIRQEEADEDAAFARQIADVAGVPFQERSLTPGPNPSEDRLRRKRYHLLGSEALGFGAAAVAVGHQKDDQAETVIQRMARGAGIRGIRGIPYKRDLPGSGGAALVRPLLDCCREDLVAYLGHRGISWREDHTNVDPHYTRNRIRHEVLPLLRDVLNANVTDALARLSALARDALAILEAEARRICEEGRQGDLPSGNYVVDRWRDRSEAVIGEALRIAFLEAGGREGAFSHGMIQGLSDAIRAGGGSFDAIWPGGIPVRLDGTRLIVGSPGGPERFPAAIAVPGVTPCPWAGLEVRACLVSPEEMAHQGGPGGGGDRRAWFDWKAIAPPLELRPWGKGEEVPPFGGPATKEVREVLADRKVPRSDRPRVPVVADREGVIWIVNHRRSSRAPVTPETSEILLLETLDTRPLGP